MPCSNCFAKRASALLGAPWLALVLASGCGIEAQDATGDHTVFRELRQRPRATQRAPEPVEPTRWSWPDGAHPHALIEVAGLGTIEIELYPELAPNTVANFQKLAAQGFYDGTTFHRVIPGFMIQGGDANTRNDDPRDDGAGGPGYTIEDEFSDAPHLRGAVSMANRGAPATGGSQFFIVHADSQHLDRDHSLFGRVVSGMDVVDRIAEVERDIAGRWGPKNRPIESLAMSKVRVAPAAKAGTIAGARQDPAPTTPEPRAAEPPASPL
ncbi:MAG: peptidylprolyl isomerase [Myxococcota bacterium]|nr:peptidylprolyl isomerase [Myxococcota bacterium]